MQEIFSMANELCHLAFIFWHWYGSYMRRFALVASLIMIGGLLAGCNT
jgi:hypothetical protein